MTKGISGPRDMVPVPRLLPKKYYGFVTMLFLQLEMVLPFPVEGPAAQLGSSRLMPGPLTLH
jgi:hypothetical protein